MASAPSDIAPASAPAASVTAATPAAIGVHSPIRISAADVHAAATNKGAASVWMPECIPWKTIAVDTPRRSRSSAVPGQESGKLENKRWMTMGAC